MSTTTYVVRVNGIVTDSRNSGTMTYTHARIDSKGKAITWHTSELNARKAASGPGTGHIVPVEAHEGGKAAVLKRLAKEAEAEATDKADVAKKAPAKDEAKPAAKKVATAGARAVPAEAANAERQAYVTEVGMAKYRNQYNGGWDAATAGAGVKKAASGTAPVAWMDGWTDRMANPGKAGIASKWAALRSTEPPVAKVDAPAEEAPAPAPAKSTKAPAKKAEPVAVIKGGKRRGVAAQLKNPKKHAQESLAAKRAAAKS